MKDRTGNLLVNLTAGTRRRVIREIPPVLFALVVEAIASGEMTRDQFIRALRKETE